MAAQFDYTGIRNTAINLIKKFGRKVPCVLMRAKEGTAPDTSKPWRRDEATVLTFPFTGLVATLGFSKYGAPIMDGDADIYIPGDLATTPSDTDPTTLAVAPLITDRIAAGDGSVYGLMGVQDINPDGTVIMWKVRGRQWTLLTQPASQPF